MSVLRHELGDTNEAVARAVTDELVDAVYAKNCRFGMTGSAEMEKIRIRRLLLSAAPLLLAAMAGNNKSFSRSVMPG